MPMSRPASFRLASLRRVSAFAAFMLVVFLARVGIVMGCEPHDLAELFADASPMAMTVAADDGDDSDSPADHGPDHCRQCQCHHGVALPSVAFTSLDPANETVGGFAAALHRPTPPERHLRPPIA